MSMQTENYRDAARKLKLHLSYPNLWPLMFKPVRNAYRAFEAQYRAAVAKHRGGTAASR